MSAPAASSTPTDKISCHCQSAHRARCTVSTSKAGIPIGQLAVVMFLAYGIRVSDFVNSLKKRRKALNPNDLRNKEIPCPGECLTVNDLRKFLSIIHSNSWNMNGINQMTPSSVCWSVFTLRLRAFGRTLQERRLNSSSSSFAMSRTASRVIPHSFAMSAQVRESIPSATDRTRTRAPMCEGTVELLSQKTMRIVACAAFDVSDSSGSIWSTGWRSSIASPSLIWKCPGIAVWVSVPCVDVEATCLIMYKSEIAHSVKNKANYPLCYLIANVSQQGANRQKQCLDTRFECLASVKKPRHLRNLDIVIY